MAGVGKHTRLTSPLALIPQGPGTFTRRAVRAPGSSPNPERREEGDFTVRTLESCQHAEGWGSGETRERAVHHPLARGNRS